MTVATNAQPFITQPTTGNETLSQAQWLEALSRILPLSQLTVFGAGKGKSTVIDWAAANGVKNVSLIEGTKEQYEHLVAVWQALHPEWQLHNQVMQASANQANTFYTASLPAESGVLAPVALNALWPNISETQRHPCEPKSLSSWAATHWQHAGQWVFIDYFCEADLLNASQDAFKNVDVLMIRVSTADQMPKALTAKAWVATLEKAGLSVVHRESERHPHIEHWLCIKSPAKTQSALEKKLENALQRAEKAKENDHKSQQQLEKQLAEQKKQQEARQQEHEKQRKQLREERDTLKKERDALGQQLATANASLDAQQAQNRHLQKLQERMEYLFEQQTLQREQAANALGQHVTHQTHATIDSVQTYIEAQKGLGVSAKALSYDGKSLPHASALLLNRTLENGSYDVVLDIGSDVTTVFLASVLQQLGADQLRITQRQRAGKSADGKLDSYTVAEAGELPKRLLGVTNSRENQQAMFNHLQHKGLEHLVDVQLSPLVEVYTADQTALFYDLTRTLQRLANLFHGRAARVLVVCAEYQQPENANTEVLLPLLLQYLASHTLEVVMLANQDEQAGKLRDTWLSCLKARELPYNLKEDAKSYAWVLTVNAV